MYLAEIMVPCFEFGANCRMDWVAVAAVGGWVAALTTFFAVLLPYRSGKRKAEIAQRLAVVDFAIFFRDLEYRARFAFNLIDTHRSNRTWFSEVDWEALRIPPIVHGLEPGKGTLSLLIEIRLLQKEISDWNAFLEIHTKIGAFGDQQRDQMIDGLHRGFKPVQERINKVRADFEVIF